VNCAALCGRKRLCSNFKNNLEISWGTEEDHKKSQSDSLCPAWIWTRVFLNENERHNCLSQLAWFIMCTDEYTAMASDLKLKPDEWRKILKWNITFVLVAYAGIEPRSLWMLYQYGSKYATYSSFSEFIQGELYFRATLQKDIYTTHHFKCGQFQVAMFYFVHTVCPYWGEYVWLSACFFFKSMLRVRANFYVYWLIIIRTLCVVRPELD
jgi:hypothetical protein